MRGGDPVTDLWPRLRTPLALLVIIASAVGLAWIGASMALDRADAELLSADLSSRLSTDYSAEAGAPPRFAPLDEAVIDDGKTDDQIALLVPEELEFAPIFTLGGGNQQVVPVAPGPGSAGGASQGPTPRPTRGPSGPAKTAQPPGASTPVPARPATATPRATATPPPPAMATPVPTPTPGHGPNPTRRPGR